MEIKLKLKQLGIALPEPVRPLAKYVPVIAHEGIAYVSGQLPFEDGELKTVGKVGAEVSLEQAKQQAKICVANGLAQLDLELGSLDRVERILRIEGFVASAPGFNAQPAVIDGASEVLCEVFHEQGNHARFAVGVSELPRNASVEVAMIVSYSNRRKLER